MRYSNASSRYLWGYGFGYRGGRELLRGTINILADDQGHKHSTTVSNAKTVTCLGASISNNATDVHLILEPPILSTIRALPLLLRCVPRIIRIHYPRSGVHPIGHLLRPIAESLLLAVMPKLVSAKRCV